MTEPSKEDISVCPDCRCVPCHCKQLKHARNHGSDECISCGAPLSLRGGYSGTDLCGPCCTGEAATMDEYGESW